MYGSEKTHDSDLALPNLEGSLSIYNHMTFAMLQS